MDMRTGAIWSGTRTAAQGIRPAAGARTAVSFAAQMAELTDSLALNDPAGDSTLKAAYDQLSDASKGVLERMKAGQGGVSKEEWTELCRELKDAGMISESDFACTRADLRAVPLPVAGMKDGCTVLHGDEGGMLLSPVKDPEWSGAPLEFLDQWMEELREMRAHVAGMRQSDGSRPIQYMNAFSSCISSCEKVSGLVRDLMQVC